MGKRESLTARGLQKVPTGIEGLDEVTQGGLPRGRPTLVCGGPGCGKSLLGMEFLIRGALQFNEPGVLMTFEETEEDMKKNVASLGFDLDQLIREKKIFVDYVKVDRQEIAENGEYDLEGLFIRLAYGIKQIGAKRVMLDTIESLFSGLSNEAILRAEVRRLFYWLKEEGMSTVITAERGDGTLTRQGLEEYVSDCVILLDHRIHNQISTRRLRVVKYRGSTHGTNEYPFLINKDGISVLPITSIGLDHLSSSEKVGTGVPRLDQMLGGAGVYRGSSVLITGSAGTGKSTLAAYFAQASVKRGERCLYFAFEESQDQILRNTSTVGLDLRPATKNGLLKFYNVRPSVHGLETHLAIMYHAVIEQKPKLVVIDPISNLATTCDEREVYLMLIRLVDFLKMHQITAIFTNLTSAAADRATTDLGVSSIMDTWLLLRDIESGGERNRGLYVLKARGLQHSNQIREFVITPKGIDLLDVYDGPEGVLTGSARLAQHAREKAAALSREQESQRRAADLERKREALNAQIKLLQTEFAEEETRVKRELVIDRDRDQQLMDDREAMSQRRKSDSLLENKSRRKAIR